MIVVIFTRIYYFIYRRIPRRTISYIISIYVAAKSYKIENVIHKSLKSSFPIPSEILVNSVTLSPSKLLFHYPIIIPIMTTILSLTILLLLLAQIQPTIIGNHVQLPSYRTVHSPLKSTPSLTPLLEDPEKKLVNSSFWSMVQIPH